MASIFISCVNDMGPALRDVDTISDARLVAEASPQTAFPAALERSGHARTARTATALL